MNTHKNKNKKVKDRNHPNMMTMVARMPLEKDKDSKKLKTTYTKYVTVEQAMKLIYGKPNFGPIKQYDNRDNFVGYAQGIIDRTPLSRKFVRRKVA